MRRRAMTNICNMVHKRVGTSALGRSTMHVFAVDVDLTIGHVASQQTILLVY